MNLTLNKFIHSYIISEAAVDKLVETVRLIITINYFFTLLQIKLLSMPVVR